MPIPVLNYLICFLGDWKVSELKSVRIGKCRKLLSLESVRIGKCWKLLGLESVRIGVSETVEIGKGQNWKESELESVRNCLIYNVLNTVSFLVQFQNFILYFLDVPFHEAGLSQLNHHVVHRKT